MNKPSTPSTPPTKAKTCAGCRRKNQPCTLQAVSAPTTRLATEQALAGITLAPQWLCIDAQACLHAMIQRTR